MRILLLISSLLFIYGNITAQKVSGYIIDASNKKGIPFATVTIENTNKGDMTDENGFFEITCEKQQNPVLIRVAKSLQAVFQSTKNYYRLLSDCVFF